MSAIGFAVNMDAIAKMLLKRGEIDSSTLHTQVLVHSEKGYEMKALRYASNLTGKGLRCENSVFETREQALRYAEEKGIPRVDFVSEQIELVERG